MRARNKTAAGRVLFYKSNAKRRGVEWSLDGSAERLLSQNCAYCGAAPAPWNGIDRMDNALGYTNENSVPCCKSCNWGKGGQMSPEQYVAHCVRVARLWYPTIGG